jgi:hypothetical protein
MWNTPVMADVGFGSGAVTMLAPPGFVSSFTLPQLVRQAEPHAQARFFEFFAVTIRNANTRRAMHAGAPTSLHGVPRAR